MKKYMILVSASMLFAMIMLFFSCSEAKNSSGNADNSYNSNPCNFEVDYSELEKIENEVSFYYVKKGTVIKHGPFMEWFDEERKQLHKCGCYRDDLGDGFYLSGGQEEFEGWMLESEMHYRGIKDGLWITWWKNGNKQEEVTYKNDKKDGLYISWWMNGKKRCEANYKDGSVEDLLTSWDENGRKRYEKNYKDGLSISWYSNGNKSIEEKWENYNEGYNMVKMTTWYRNGNKWEEGYYDDGRWIHWWYNEDGTCKRGLDYGDGSGKPIEIECP